jgi:hypothetical protein
MAAHERQLKRFAGRGPVGCNAEMRLAEVGRSVSWTPRAPHRCGRPEHGELGSKWVSDRDSIEALAIAEIL